MKQTIQTKNMENNITHKNHSSTKLEKNNKILPTDKSGTMENKPSLSSIIPPIE